MEKIEYNKELSKIIVAIAIIQVLLMINTSVAESYTINKTNEVVQEKIIENKIKKESMNYGLKLLVLLLAIKQIGIVSAVDVQGVCCPQTKNGAICQDILSTDTVSCAIDTVPTECKAYAPCKLGCCVDPTRGSCDERTTQESCLEMRGNWKEGEDCLIQECQKGCCMSTRSNSFINEKECKYASEREGLQEDFRDVETQIECLALFATNEEGACLMEDNACIRTDGNDCLSKGGSFAAGFLCSHPQLNTSCTRQNYTGCDPEGILDGIYWYDSCRNRENIYDSNKDRSWNDGKILKQQESCDPNEGNINDKNCGNCQRAESSICSSSSGSNKIKDGNFICKDLRCYDAESNKWRQNGESWCMYDGYIGNGRDTVGSEHWLSKCIDGEISKPYEMCGDGARSGICVEEKISDGAYTRSTASCIVNTATECLTNQFYKNDSEGGQTRAEVISLADQNDVDISNILLNGDETRYNWDGIKNCMKNNQCMIKKTGIGSSFNFALCLPQYPKGANLTDGIDDNLCAIGNLLPCTVVERKKGFGSWDCVENCECKTKAFAEKMNNICTSVGDCGSYVNYMGEGTDNYNVKGDSVLAWAFKCKSLEKVINLCEIECVGGGSIGSSCSGNKPQGFNDFILSYYEEMCKDEIHGYCQNGEYFIRDSIRVKWQDYKSYADVKKGQYASPPNFTEELQSMFGDETSPGSAEFSYKSIKLVGEITGGIGAALWASTLIPGIASGSVLFSTTAIGSVVQTLPADFIGPPAMVGLPVTIGTLMTATASIAIGAVVGNLIAKSLGLSGSAVTWMIVAGGMAGLAVALLIGAIGNAWNPAGIVLAIAALIIGIGTFLFSFRYREKSVEFQCLPWEAPPGGASCEECNKDINRPCNEYRCSSLGKTCRIVDTGFEYPECKALEEENPKVAPVITPLKLDQGYKFFNKTSESVSVRTTNQKCIPEFTPIQITLQTDENAQCKWTSAVDFEAFNAMGDEFPQEGNAYSINHTFEFSMPSIESLQDAEVSGDVKEKFANINYYVVCSDYWGTYNVKKYKVNLCVNNGPDKTPVDYRFTKTIPVNEVKVKLGVSEVPLTMYINEPAECRYGTNPGMNYNLMPNNMSCQTDVTGKGIFGWPCITTLKLSNQSTNNFYIKCKDQPWLPLLNDSQRNINVDDFKYTVHITRDVLEINEVYFEYDEDRYESESVIKEGFEPITVNMKVETSGGIDSGKSLCKWGILPQGSRWPFENSGDSSHAQRLTSRFGGMHNNYIECEDIVGNKAYSSGNFTLDIDHTPPVVVNITNETYGTQIDVTITTDEEAECYYNNYACSSNFVNQTPISNGMEIYHVIENLNKRLDYFVSCVDRLNNSNPACATVISAKEKNDGSSPELARIFYDKYGSGGLKLITEEEARCSYALADCSYEIDDGISMDEEYSLEHQADWNKQWTYHIRCEDSWHNKNSGCLIVVKPGELI